MNVFIRTDASLDIGTGHVMRCLVLAQDLRKRKVSVTFICRQLPGNLIEHIKANGYKVYDLPPIKKELQENQISHLQWHNKHWEIDARQTIQVISKQKNIDWLVVDHYGIDHNWEHTIKSFVKKVMVIDDMANRSHDCHLLLDQNLYKNIEKRYENLIPDYASTLLGTKYLLLRQEFREIKKMKKRNGIVKRILISFGGSDPTNETIKALKAIKMVDISDIAVDVVVGPSNKNYSSIKQCCKCLPNTRIHYQVSYLAKLMSKADLAIGAGGSTTWERCYLGLPAITIETAKNQSEILTHLSEIGVILHLGESQTVSEEDLANTLKSLIYSPEEVIEMSNNSKYIMKDFEKCAVANRLIRENIYG